MFVLQLVLVLVWCGVCTTVHSPMLDVLRAAVTATMNVGIC